MTSSSYKKISFFPKLLEPNTFGLDISDNSIKYAEILPSKRGWKVGKYGKKLIAPGIIKFGRIENKEKMVNLLNHLKKDIGIKSVRISLPEEQSYLFTITLPKTDSEQIMKKISLLLDAYVPMLAEEMAFEYQILEEIDHMLNIRVIATPKEIINEYTKVFEKAKIKIKEFKLKAESLAKNLHRKNTKKIFYPSTSMLVELERNRSSVSVIHQGSVVFNSVLDKGVNENERVESLRDELTRHYIYWHTHKDDEGKERPKIKKIILVGEGKDLSELAEYFSKGMKIPVELANVWANILNIEEDIPEMDFKESLAFASAISLALEDKEIE